MIAAASQPALRLIQGALEDAPGSSWFCAQCAARPTFTVAPAARVCESCGMGVMLETRSDAAPGPDDAFIVVDARLTVQVLSLRAEALLGARERNVLDRPIARFLVTAGTERGRTRNFMTLLTAASAGSDEVHSLFVRPLGAFGVRALARIAPCGPPRAALVVLDAGGPRRDLRVV